MEQFGLLASLLSVKALKELGIEVKNTHTEIKFNDHVFDVIDTEENPNVIVDNITFIPESEDPSLITGKGDYYHDDNDMTVQHSHNDSEAASSAWRVHKHRNNYIKQKQSLDLYNITSNKPL